MTKQITPLRQPIIDDMRMRNMSPSTEKVYTYAVANSVPSTAARLTSSELSTFESTGCI